MRLLLAAFVVAGLAKLTIAAGDTPSPRAPEGEGVAVGYRGVPFPLPGAQLHFLKKGDYVDLLATFDASVEKNIKEKVTTTMLQYVKVLDIYRPAKIDEMGAVVLQLNPNESQYLALSRAQGDIQILIRPPQDKEMHPMEMAAMRKLFR